MANKNDQDIELILGIVAAIGTDKKSFITLLKSELAQHDFDIIEIKATKNFINLNEKNFKPPKSLQYFLKMQICSELRKKSSPSILTYPIISSIKSNREKHKKNKRTGNKYNKIIYIIDQLKNVGEYNILKHIYGLNYIQLSLFSNETNRNNNLEKSFDKDKFLFEMSDKNKLIKQIIDNIKIKNKNITEYISKEIIENFVCDYIKNILADASSELLHKDFDDTDQSFSKNLNNIKIKSGQQVADLFHRSTYFINVDNEADEIHNNITKFINLLEGRNEEYPTQDEFGMAIAYQSSVRSNYPSDRHVGAAIISEYGEVLSVASIRAPSPNSNTTLHDKCKIAPGYEIYKKRIANWQNEIMKIIDYLESKNKNIIKAVKSLKLENKQHILNEISKFMGNILDFHPCTHAEIATIIDAAKVGIPIRGATMYTTTYPCHLCAKDIICAGIKRVVYLEAYPKSKNKDLYPKLINNDPEFESDRILFEHYNGINSQYFYKFYSLENHLKGKENSIFSCEITKYYELREKHIKSHLKLLLDNISLNLKKKKTKKCKDKHLCDLIHPESKDELK